MSIAEACMILRDDDAGLTRWVEAAGTLTSSAETSYEDLLVCLGRPGVPAEMGATALYVRTSRPRKDEGVSSVITDRRDWQEYLKMKNLI